MYAIKAMSKHGQACVKEIVNGYEISMAFDDSCGTQKELVRGDIRIYRGDTDVTALFFGSGTVVANGENFVRAYLWCLERGKE